MTYLIARYWPHILIVAISATIVATIAYAVGSASGDRRAAKAEQALSHMERDTAYRLAEEQAKARALERAKAEAVAKVAEEYEREKADAQAKSEAVVAGLRAGTVRLRQHWKAAVATCDVSRDSATARHADEIAQLRAESAARIIRVGAEADAQVKALQEAYEALRRPAPSDPRPNP